MLFLLYQDLYGYKQHDILPLVRLLQDAVRGENQTVPAPAPAPEKHIRQVTVRVLVSPYIYYKVNP